MPPKPVGDSAVPQTGSAWDLSAPNGRGGLRKTVGVIAVVLVLLAVVAAALLFGLPALRGLGKPQPNQGATVPEARPSAELVPGKPNTLLLPPDVARELHVQTAEARAAAREQPLVLSGRLALDANRLARVHSRFPGEVVKIEEAEDNVRPGGRTTFRPLRPGDRVSADQRLAVVWSKDLGEKKSELVDAMSKLRLDRETLNRLRDLFNRGSLPERSLREAERNVESDEIAVDRAERTLRSWRLTDAEIDAVKAEAERILRKKGDWDKKADQDWAKVEVRAPFAGTIVEKNVAQGDIVDVSTDLFKIADVSTLAVWADAYEEELPALLALPPERRTWTVRLKAEPGAAPLQGSIDTIGEIIDPNQHTALVIGRVDNRRRLLRAGQFITATVELPSPPDEVRVPAAAVIDDGRTSVVFVQEDPSRPEYTLRQVAVARRLPAAVVLRSRVTPDEERRGLRPVRPGERVVSKGAVELRSALEDLQAEGKAGE